MQAGMAWHALPKVRHRAAPHPLTQQPSPTHLDKGEAAGAQARVGIALAKVHQPAAGVAACHGRPQPRIAGKAAQHRKDDCMVAVQEQGGVWDPGGNVATAGSSAP